jgi:hypothetical protein
MKQFTVTIPDNKESLFMELMKSLSFVKNVETIESTDIPEWHKAIIDQRMAAYRENPDDVLDFDKAMDDLEREL